MNVSIPLNYTVNNSMVKVMDCGSIRYSLSSKVDATFKIIVLVIPLLVLFQSWAVSKVSKSKETDDRKKMLIDMCLTFITPVIIVLIFYLIYWIWLSGIDF